MLPLLLWIALDWKAEFCGHSVPFAGTTYFTPNHIVVEVEVLPDKGDPIRLTSGQFRLRVNSKKDLLVPETPGLVAGTLKYDDWNQRGSLQAQAGPVILGGPRQTPRFPGDPQSGRLPVPQTNPNAPENEPKKTDAEAVVEAALPEGPTLGPTKGLIYFPYRGKIKNLKSLELVWQERVLKLR